MFDRLFREGGIHWGRIITLLCFGYRLAITYLRRGVVGFFTNIISWVVKFVVSERIAQWIADQGGWVRSPPYSQSVAKRHSVIDKQSVKRKLHHFNLLWIC